MEIIRCDTIQFTLRCLSTVTIKKSLSFNIGSSKKKKKQPSHTGLKTRLWPFGNHLSWRQKCAFTDWLVSGYLWSVVVAASRLLKPQWHRPTVWLITTTRGKCEFIFWLEKTSLWLLWSLADFGVRPQLIWNMPTFLHLQAAAELWKVWHKLETENFSKIMFATTLRDSF